MAIQTNLNHISSLACWSQDPHLRPTFTEISELLKGAPSESQNFVQIRESWRAEIDCILKEKIENKEKELQSREATLAKIYELQKTHEDYLKFVEQQLREKEITLLERELTIALKPEPRKRRKQSKFGGKFKGSEFISGPKDFRHKLNIQPVLVGDLRSRNSQSSPNLVEPNTSFPQQPNINNIIYRIGTMASGAIGVDISNQNNSTSSTSKTNQVADLKYYTYAGRSAKRRSSLPKISTEVWHEDKLCRVFSQYI